MVGSVATIVRANTGSATATATATAKPGATTTAPNAPPAAIPTSPPANTGAALAPPKTTPPPSKTAPIVAAIERIPAHYRESLYALLDDPRFTEAITKDSGIFLRIAGGDIPAIGALADAMPDSALKTDLRMVHGVLANPDNPLRKLVSLVSSPEQLHAQVMSAAAMMGPALASPEANLVLTMMRAFQLPAGAILKDIVEGKIDRALVDRVIAARVQPSDVLTLLRILRDKKGGTIDFDPRAGIAELTQRYGSKIPALYSLSFVDRLRFTKNDDLELHFSKDIPKELLPQLPPTVKPGDTVTLHVSQLDRAGLRARMHLNVFEVVDQFYRAIDFHPTKIGFFDGLLTLIVRLLAGLLFPLVLLVIAIGRPQLRFDWHENGESETYVSLYGIHVVTYLKRTIPTAESPPPAPDTAH